MKLDEYRFAFIQTLDAVYDRVAVIVKNNYYVTVQYPEKRAQKYRIRNEDIQVRKIIKFQYYQEERKT